MSEECVRVRLLLVTCFWLSCCILPSIWKLQFPMLWGENIDITVMELMSSKTWCWCLNSIISQVWNTTCFIWKTVWQQAALQFGNSSGSRILQKQISHFSSAVVPLGEDLQWCCDFKSLRHDLDISTWCVDTCQMICLVFAFVQPKPISLETYSVRLAFDQEVLTLLEFWSLVSLPGFTCLFSPWGFCFRSCPNSLRLAMPSWQSDSDELGTHCESISCFTSVFQLLEIVYATCLLNTSCAKTARYFFACLRNPWNTGI